MSLYLIVFLFLIGFAVFEFWRRRTNMVLYWIAFVMLTIMLVLRFGQGTDYYGYWINYLYTPPITDFTAVINSPVHGEPGWLVVNAVLRAMNMPFYVLVVVVACLDMFFLHRFIAKYCPLKITALLLSYPTIYLTYAMSALRQGLVICVFLGLLLEWFRKRRILCYVIVTTICVFIHSSSLVFFVPLVGQYLLLDTKKTLIFITAALLIGFGNSSVLAMLSSSIANYAKSGISIMAIGERMISTAVILFVFRDELEGYSKQNRPTLQMLLQVFLYGVIIYSFFAWSALLSSRFAVAFKAVEIALFAIALMRPGKYRYVVALYLLGLTALMYYKNINSYIEQGNYFDSVNVWNYPYFSVFDREKIELFRTLPYDSMIFDGQF